MLRWAQGKPLFVLAALLALAPSSVSAQGLLQSLFGGMRRPVYRPVEPLPPPAWSDSLFTMRPSPGPAVQSRWQTYCVRLCDGRYFPVPRRTGMSAGEACNAFCPAAETKLFSGSGIDYATADDGTRYAGLPTAYAYRKYFVVNCTCNGTSPIGLAPVSPTDDPTLRAGDIVVSDQGFLAYTGRQQSQDGARENRFTPVNDYRGVSASLRDRLADIPVVPTPIPVVLTPPAASVQLIGAPLRPAGFTPAPKEAPAPPAPTPPPYWSLNLRAQLDR